MGNRYHDAQRYREQPWRAWYSRAAWKRARARQLALSPLCERCSRSGLVVAADTVNHRKAHKGDWSLFVDPSNHESVCKACHDSEVSREERSGRTVQRIAADGWPCE